ncbi:aldehyde dehydrogenase 3b1 [Trichoderma arundinaceum]|uniref:Aldehyde dehydrogenase n=1 Tax=Trichoderma arundinaceum TaxID=490622 RepID=A0A395N8M5_TRIAR|nr:aldehyde dehydrogenase 3b1 [Trichoderma arundinaceum]
MALKTSGIPPLHFTALDDITAQYNTVRATFRSGRTKNVEYRKQQIRRLYWAVVDNAELIELALNKDMGKSKFEANISEIDWCKQECLDAVENLDKWVKDENVRHMPFQFWAMKPRIRHEPLGTILNIGAYNFPFQLNVTALVGAIAAGNTFVLKPSEISPHSAMVLQKLFDEALDPEAYVCVQGSIDETKHILEHKFDKIVFTGGRKTGTIIAQKAAETLTPVLLELGGQNPAFITRHGDLKLAARRLMWQKCLNAGQVCLSHNYALVERCVLNRFIDEVKKTYAEFMPQGAKASPDFARVVNQGHYNRLKRMLDNSKGKIVVGGSMDEADFFIEPTVVLVDDVNDSMVVEESFGPIWSIVPFDTLDEAINIANQVDPTPLALFTFGSDKENDKVLNSVTSGGATINDGFFHAMLNPSPLGGVGSSGTGNYHGYYSFKTFSHQRSIAKVPGWADKLLRVRYMPYSVTELKRHRRIAEKKPNFDRNGNLVKGLKYWLTVLLSLGSKNASGFVFRFGVLIALAVTLGLKRKSLGI